MADDYWGGREPRLRYRRPRPPMSRAGRWATVREWAWELTKGLGALVGYFVAGMAFLVLVDAIDIPSGLFWFLVGAGVVATWRSPRR